MVRLPIHLDSNKSLMLMQTTWSGPLNKLLANPLLDGFVIEDVALINGETTINHRLGRKMQGYIVTDLNASAIIYRSKPLNDKTLSLTSSASCVVNIYVY